MARLVDRRIRVRIGAFARLFAATPERAEYALRLAVTCAVVTWIAEFYQTPDVALTAYVAFFLMARDRVTSIVMSIVELLVVTLVIGLVLGITMWVIDAPLARVACIASLSFGLLFLASSSKLRPLASIIALVVGYGLDLLGGFPGGEVATRLLLYAWLFVGIPAATSVVINLLFGPAPRRLAEHSMAESLRCAVALLRHPDARTRKSLELHLRQAEGERPKWLKMAALEKTSPAEDIAALREASASTVALLVQADLATRDGEGALPAQVRAAAADVLDEMAAILDSGGYPVAADLPMEAAAVTMTPAQSALLSGLRATIAEFAEAPSATAESSAPEKAKGFFLPDAFTNPLHVQYALKTTAAAMFCYLLYQQLDWPGIHTCFITCYIVALPTVAETVEKLGLRIAGCLVGGALGFAAMILLIPATTSIGGLMIVVFAGAFVAAWIAGGGPNIAYAGFQLAFAFFLCVLQGASPDFDFTIARDRLIGILLGNLAVYLVFTRIWPVGVTDRVDPAIAAALRRLADMAGAATMSARQALAAQVLAAVAAATRELDLASYEPPQLRPSTQWLRRRRRIVRSVLRATAPLLLAAHDSLAGKEAAQRMQALVRRIEGDAPALQPVRRGRHDGEPLWEIAEDSLRALEHSVPLPEAREGDVRHAFA